MEKEITERQYRALMATQGAWLSPDQIARLSPDQIARLSPDQIARLSPDQIARLSPAGIARLSPDQIARLSPDQIARLSPAGMKKHAALWDKVPTVSGLYGRILTDIKTERRHLDQGSFGPYREPVAVCESPMCIAGHTVSVAGIEGYRLLDYLKGDFAAAAACIHTKSLPTTPRPRYDSYPNEFALAYIEERAAEEKEGVR